jgi:hypothetical protein
VKMQLLCIASLGDSTVQVLFKLAVIRPCALRKYPPTAGTNLPGQNSDIIT